MGSNIWENSGYRSEGYDACENNNYNNNVMYGSNKDERVENQIILGETKHGSSIRYKWHRRGKSMYKSLLETMEKKREL